MKYGPDKTKEICAYLANGNFRINACSKAKISYETFTEWMQKPEFAEAVKEAESDCIDYHLVIIKEAAKKDWRASAWYLERRVSEYFADKKPFNQNISPDAALKMAETTLRLMRELNSNGLKETGVPSGHSQPVGDRSTPV